jgi:uncharacterized protein YbgA (DUF1722 family)/uncharacterized protein YbbK (DUF523 family)
MVVAMQKIPLGISQCLMGDKVRFDGSHKHNHFLTDQLGKYVEFFPVCPEVAIGLGIPRKPIRLIVSDSQDRIRGIENPDLDVTDALMQQAESVAASMPQICGYVFMQNSPSCGVFGLKRYHTNGHLLDTRGRGAYAKRLIELMPLLPAEESGRLCDGGLRENFVTRIFAYHDWQMNVAPGPTAKKLIDFYSRYKYLVMAHHVPSYLEAGRLLADLSKADITGIADKFIRLFMAALRHPASKRSHLNVLIHLRGYLKNHIDAQEKSELTRVFDHYAQGLIPLVVPLTLLKHHLMTLDDPYLKNQVYWQPFPDDLALRNFVAEK